MTLSTTPGDIYRALIEATAFGTRRILAAFTEHDVEVRELIAVGGLADRSPLLLQIYADVTGLPIARVTPTTLRAGAAMLGSVAAGKRAGGHASLRDAPPAWRGCVPRSFPSSPTPPRCRCTMRAIATISRCTIISAARRADLMPRLRHR